MSSFTARVVDPGMYYENRRNHQLVRVPVTHHAVVCGACTYAVHIPARLGRDRAEQLRRDHLLSAHLTQLSTGAVVLTEIPPLFSTAASTAPVRHMSLRGDADESPGAADGTVEHDEARLVAEPLDSAVGAGLDGPTLSPGRHYARAG